jgi:hypothetical protein
MPYYVVNAGRVRSTHIMKSKSPSISGLGTFIVSNVLFFGGGTVKSTLCGLQATRYVNVFKPEEASCRECRRRWQLEVAAGIKPSPPLSDRKKRAALERIARDKQARWRAEHVPGSEEYRATH